MKQTKPQKFEWSPFKTKLPECEFVGQTDEEYAEGLCKTNPIPVDMMKNGLMSVEDFEAYAEFLNGTINVSQQNATGEVRKSESPVKFEPFKFRLLTRCIERELKGATEKFPSNEHTLAALTEELGELAQALLQMDYEGTKTADDVFKEAVQVASTAIKIALYGDHGFSYNFNLVKQFRATGEKI